MWKWLRRLLIVGVLAAVVVGASYPLMNWMKQRALPKYLTAEVTRGRVETVVNSTGTIKPVRTVSVGAFTSGPILEVNVDYNSIVYKKTADRPATILARIDPKLLQAAVDQDKAAIDAQKADLERVRALRDQARNSEKRAHDLQGINKDYLSDTEMDQYKFSTLSFEAQYKLAEATIRQAEARLKNSEQSLSYSVIIAPDDGVIIDRKVDPGQTVQGSFQTPEMFTIGVEMNKHMHVYASVDEADIGQIQTAKKEDRDVKFTVDSYPGEVFKGKIREIRLNATTTQNVVTYPVIIDAPNEERKLLPNMTANLSFQIEQKDDVVRVPASALRFVPLSAQVRPEDKHYVEGALITPAEGGLKRSAEEKAEQAKKRQRRVVWVQDGPLLRAVPVTLGLMENQYAELLSGDLTEGQVVVTGVDNPFAPR